MSIKEVNIVNPVAGKGDSIKIVKSSTCPNSFITSGTGYAERFVIQQLNTNPYVRFNIYGGDGTINEVVNGIMQMHAGDRSEISVIPVGTGNDFFRNIAAINAPKKIDLIKCNYRYAVNMINIGYDCSVAIKAADIKSLPLLNGSTAYILGVLRVLILNHKEKLDIELTSPDGMIEKRSGSFLLTTVANGCYCGGGFKSSPLSIIDDDELEITVVKPVSRTNILRFVKYYKNGSHIISENGDVIKQASNILEYKKCRKVKISGFKQFCADGEVIHDNEITIEVVPKAVTVVPV